MTSRRSQKLFPNGMPRLVDPGANEGWERDPGIKLMEV